MMFLLFSLFLSGVKLAKENNNPEANYGNMQEGNTINKLLSQNNYKIISVNPNKCSAAGNIEVELTVDPHPTGNVYCRFDSQIVQGKNNGNGVVSCVAPSHVPGDVPLYFSDDQVSWSASFTFQYYDNTTVIILVILLIVSFISFGLFYFQMRQCKNQSRNHRQHIKALDEPMGISVDSDEPKQRNLNLF